MNMLLLIKIGSFLRITDMIHLRSLVLCSMKTNQILIFNKSGQHNSFEKEGRHTHKG